MKTTTSKTILILTCLLITVMVITASAQEKKESHSQMMRIEADGEVHIIQELGALISEKDSTLEVMAIFLPPENRQPAYKDDDLQEGDKILMVNGNKVTSVAKLIELLDEVEIGDKIKMGLKRDKSMRLISYDKSDNAGAGMMMKTVTIDGNDGLQPVPDLGCILKADEGKLIVDNVLPKLSDLSEDITFMAGDIIVSLNATEVTNPNGFLYEYDYLEVGDPVTIIVMREGTEIRLSFNKPKPTSVQIIKGN